METHEEERGKKIIKTDKPGPYGRHVTNSRSVLIDRILSLILSLYLLLSIAPVLRLASSEQKPRELSAGSLTHVSTRHRYRDQV